MLGSPRVVESFAVKGDARERDFSAFKSRLVALISFPRHPCDSNSTAGDVTGLPPASSKHRRSLPGFYCHRSFPSKTLQSAGKSLSHVLCCSALGPQGIQHLKIAPRRTCGPRLLIPERACRYLRYQPLAVGILTVLAPPSFVPHDELWLESLRILNVHQLLADVMAKP